LPTVWKPFRVRGEEYQVRYGQYRAHHPYAGGYHERRLPAKSRPERVYYGYVPATRLMPVVLNINYIVKLGGSQIKME